MSTFFTLRRGEVAAKKILGTARRISEYLVPNLGGRFVVRSEFHETDKF
jgi:hypothetical protein